MRLILFLIMICWCNASTVTVKTTEGVVLGEEHSWGTLFSAIPYAAPPVGNLRFKPPQKVQPWEGVYDGRGKQKICMQRITMFFPVDGGELSEDCLQLNVWVPKKSSSDPLPVMVWIHGGAFVIGSAHQSIYDMDLFCQKTQTVVVAINYRLGVFGHFAHPNLTNEDPNHLSSGNYFFEDQRFALEWVQRNIASFGGDPKRVTIFGESAGGTSVQFHILSPLSKGLFHRAISQSAILCDFEPQDQADVSRVGWLKDVKDKSIEELREIPAEKFLDYNPPDLFISDDRICYCEANGVNDNLNFISNSHLQAIKDGNYNKVPLLIGSVKLEQGSFYRRYKMAFSYDTLVKFYNYSLESKLKFEEILNKYYPESKNNPLLTHAQIQSHWSFTCREMIAAVEISKNEDVWWYTFGGILTKDKEDHLGGATHAGELPFLFEKSIQDIGFLANDKDDLILGNEMAALWGQFAHMENELKVPGKISFPKLKPTNKKGLFLNYTYSEFPLEKELETCYMWENALTDHNKFILNYCTLNRQPGDEPFFDKYFNIAYLIVHYGSMKYPIGSRVVLFVVILLVLLIFRCLCRKKKVVKKTKKE